VTTPKTLLEMAGAKLSPPDWNAAALVLVDCQREYVDGALPLPGVGPALAEAAKVVDLAREAGAPVVHVVHHGAAGGGVFDPEAVGSHEAPEIAAAEGEAVVSKGLPNSFAGTSLQQELEATGRKSLVVVGFMTHMCVSSTVRAGLDLGYSCTVVDKACATRDLPDGQGGVIAAAELHRAELAALADRFALVVNDASAWS